ncbi:MAG: hypothetical protein AAF772_11175, partial [Acidobacteriota bacterium]
MRLDELFMFLATVHVVANVTICLSFFMAVPAFCCRTAMSIRLAQIRHRVRPIAAGAAGALHDVAYGDLCTDVPQNRGGSMAGHP